MPSFPPTEEQAAIIEAVKRRESIIVNALAGAAKTSTIVMAAPFAPLGTLALAFNKHIQLELESKLPNSFACKTINGLGHGVWMKTAGRLELDSGKLTKILKRLDPKAPWDIAKIVSSAKLAGLVPQSCLAMGRGVLEDTPTNWESLADDMDTTLTREDPDTKVMIDYLPLARKVLEVSIKEAYTSSIDFDDQVYMPTCFGGQFPKYECVFVDEAQDLSPLNHLMLKRMAPKMLVVVGDPLQSIYAFRGADTQSMPKLAEDWKLKPYTLSICFRCGKKIAEMASRWATNIQSPDWIEDGKVIQSLEALNLESKPFGGWTLSDMPERFTVICRNNAPLIKLALKIFKEKRISFVNGRAEESMLSSIRKLVNYKKNVPLDNILSKLAQQIQNQLANEDPKKHERLIDANDALTYCVEAAMAEGRDQAGLEKLISELFQNKNPEVWFATGHAAKGKEWDNVLHLDPHLLPSRWATSEEAQQQEANIHYVITTRAKKLLAHADSRQFTKE